MPEFDAGSPALFQEMLKRYLDDYPGDVVCPLQAWYEGLGGQGTPDEADMKAMRTVLEGLEDWKSIGEIRYEKFGKQPSYRRVGFVPDGAMVQHRFKLNGLYRGPDGKLLKVVLSEVYNLRCFEIADGNMVGPMIKIHPASDYADQMVEAG
ncbi:MAG: hypothetical protein LBS00_06855 [Synergistaceae bacterium]|nr:hypothetical protein [Synergistaceae bacterium]